MFGRLLKRFFGGRDRARPVSPPPPPLPSRPAAASGAAPPPPPPLAAAPANAAPSEHAAPADDPVVAQITDAPVQVVPEGDSSERSRVRFVLEDGTMASPALDPDLEERLKYIVDNIVPPSEPDST